MNNVVWYTEKQAQAMWLEICLILFISQNTYLQGTQQVQSEQVINDLLHRGLQCRRKEGRGDWCSMAVTGNETKN